MPPSADLRNAPALRILPPVAEPERVIRKRRVAPTLGRVLVMDGHPMVEEWIGTLLGGQADLVCAGHATDLANTAALVARGHPSLVLLEIAKDIPGGLELVRALKAKFPKLRMLVFSSCDEIAHSVQVLHAGAHGFVSKTASGPELLRAIRQVLEDGVYLSSAMIGHLAAGAPDSPAAPKTGPEAVLSQRELQVFAFIGEGLHPTEIAQRISLSVKTVESYLVRIRQKLNLRDARALFKDAVKWSKARDRAEER
jgi:DNA-binding NarL/FixJ family response regulator